MKRILIVFTFATLLASCSTLVDLDDAGKEQGKASPVAVGFEAYVNRATKAGQTGDLTTDILKTTGFGVLGYASNGIPFNERLTPDFMYNQPVTCPAGTWTYDPIKYWPNEENIILPKETRRCGIAPRSRPAKTWTCAGDFLS